VRPPFPRLLVNCTRPDVDLDVAADSRRLATAESDWTRLIANADEHGLAPLLREHLRTAGADVPAGARRTLAATAAREADTARVRTAVLGEIVGALDAEGIPSVALKGPAIAIGFYEEPSSRPMRDLDILVAADEARLATAVLARLGFVDLAGADPVSHHLTPMHRRTRGVQVVVELHVDAVNETRPFALRLVRDGGKLSLIGGPGKQPNDSWVAVETFGAVCVDGHDVRTLAPVETLWHLCIHIVQLYQPLRLIAVADILRVEKRLLALPDGLRGVTGRYPRVEAVLALLHALVDRTANAESGPDVGRLRDVGLDYDGWPRRLRPNAGAVAEWLQDTLNPGDWWLGLHYGVEHGRESARSLRRRHLAAIARAAALRARARIGSRRALAEGC
jgi:hypothetical protein